MPFDNWLLVFLNIQIECNFCLVSLRMYSKQSVVITPPLAPS